MHDWDLEALGNRKKLADLIGNQALKLDNRNIESGSSEASQVGITRMRTHRYMILTRELKRLLHGKRIARMPPTRYARGCYVTHQFGIAAVRKPLA
jgi:hypothetical protein